MVQRNISYAQNFEDALIKRCFAENTSGTYIDIGSYHPVHDSVTKIFYDAGWTGINIEANPTLIDEFVTQRPRDINLNLMVGQNSTGFGSLVVPLQNKGLGKAINTTQNTNNPINQIRTYKVPNRTLTDIIVDFNFEKVDFLKIDIEGEELSAIKGLDFNLCSPKIVIIEIFDGKYDAVNINAINDEMASHNYSLVYCDGINNFYLFNEQLSWAKFFKYPINVLDNYMKYSEFCLMQENIHLKNISDITS